MKMTISHFWLMADPAIKRSLTSKPTGPSVLQFFSQSRALSFGPDWVWGGGEGLEVAWGLGLMIVEANSAIDRLVNKVLHNLVDHMSKMGLLGHEPPECNTPESQDLSHRIKVFFVREGSEYEVAISFSPSSSQTIQGGNRKCGLLASIYFADGKSIKALAWALVRMRVPFAPLSMGSLFIFLSSSMPCRILSRWVVSSLLPSAV